MLSRGRQHPPPCQGPGSGGGATHRADETQQPCPGEGPVGDGHSSRGDRDSLHRAEGTGQAMVQDEAPQAGGRAWHAHSAGASPMSAEGKRQPQARSLCCLMRPSLGSHTQGSPTGLCFCVCPFICMLPGPGPEEWVLTGPSGHPNNSGMQSASWPGQPPLLSGLHGANSQLTRQSSQGGWPTAHGPLHPLMPADSTAAHRYKPQRHSS